MTSSMLHAVETEFDDRHVPLHIVLGAIAVLKRLRPLLPRQGADGAPRDPASREDLHSSNAAEPTAGTPEAELALYALLGVAGLSRNFAGHLRTASIPRSRMRADASVPDGSRRVEGHEADPWLGLLR